MWDSGWNRIFSGKSEVPKDAYYGIFTVRAAKNFQISGLRAPKKIHPFTCPSQKGMHPSKHGARDSGKENRLSHLQASDEVLTGKSDDQFPLDIYQAGAGTPYNMNMNEVLANRALEILGFERGRYDVIGPNNHPNASQSSNDVIPTATRISVLSVQDFLPSLKKLENTLRDNGKRFSNIVKTGRIHYQDAVPFTLGQEFDSYANKMEGAEGYLLEASEHLKDLGIGGTAIGTGINTHPRFSEMTIKYLNNLTGLGFRVAADKIEKTQNFDDFVAVSNALRILSIDLLKISNDIKLLNSGPNAGIAEIMLPAVEPGSSIMPGKINPSIPECVDMVSFQIIGRDQTMMMSSANGVLELNVYVPIIMYDLTDSLSILKNALEMFADDCISGIVPNEEKIKEYLEHGLIITTALNPLYGYAKVARVGGGSAENGKNNQATTN